MLDFWSVRPHSSPGVIGSGIGWGVLGKGAKIKEAVSKSVIVSAGAEIRGPGIFCSALSALFGAGMTGGGC